MVRIPHRDGADTVGLGPADHVRRGQRRQHLAHAVMAVDDADGAAVDDLLRGCDRFCRAGLEPGDIPGQPHHAMGRMPPQVGLNQGVGREMRVVRGHADGLVGGSRESQQPVGCDPRWRIIGRHGY